MHVGSDGHGDHGRKKEDGRSGGDVELIRPLHETVTPSKSRRQSINPRPVGQEMLVPPPSQAGHCDFNHHLTTALYILLCAFALVSLAKDIRLEWTAKDDPGYLWTFQIFLYTHACNDSSIFSNHHVSGSGNVPRSTMVSIRDLPPIGMRENKYSGSGGQRRALSRFGGRFVARFSSCALVETKLGYLAAPLQLKNCRKVRVGSPSLQRCGTAESHF